MSVGTRTTRCACGSFLGTAPTCDDCGRGRPETTPQAALAALGTLYRTPGTGSKSLHAHKRCQTLRAAERDPDDVTDPAGIRLSASLCRVCFEEVADD